MSSIPRDKLDRLLMRWDAVQSELNAGVGQAQFTRLSKEFAELDPVVGAIRELRAAEANCTHILRRFHPGVVKLRPATIAQCGAGAFGE